MNLLIILKDKIFKNERYLILFILLLSVFSRGIAAFYFGDRNLENEWGILIKNLYNHNTLALLKFDDLFVPNLWMPPVYAYFIYIHVLIFDLGEFLVPSVIFTQIIISSITSIIFYKILLILFSKNYSILGAIIFCLFPLIIYSTSQISSVTIYLFLLTYFLYLILILKDKNSFKNILIIGLIAGVLILTRRDFLLIYLLSLTYIFIFFKINFKKIVLMIAITVITISPYIIRNYLSFNKLVIHSGFGYNVWKAYNPKAKVEGYYIETNDLKAKLKDVKKDIYYRFNEDKIYLDEAIKYISDEPEKYLVLFAKRLFAFYFYDTDSSQSNYYNSFHIYPILIFSILSLLGLLIYNKSNSKYNYLILILFTLVIIYSSFAILPRYKIYILPFQILLSISGIKYLFEKLRIKN